MTHPSVFVCLMSVLLPTVSGTPWRMQEGSLLERELDTAKVAAPARRHLQWAIDFQPGADPEFVCKSFETAANGTYECSCDVQPDKSVGLNCLVIEKTCNADSSICFKQNVNFGLTTDNVIKEMESCTQYVGFNYSLYEGSSTKFANYSAIVPCVKVEPEKLGDFSSPKSCSATINGEPCNKCEICRDKAPLMGITLDCCNTNPDGEPLKVTCGPMGGGGAFAPFFDTYQEGQEGQCSWATPDFRSSLLPMAALLVSLVWIHV